MFGAAAADPWSASATARRSSTRSGLWAPIVFDAPRTLFGGQPVKRWRVRSRINLMTLIVRSGSLI